MIDRTAEPMDVYVESAVGGHIDNATQAWTFDIDHWGGCGQGDNEATALAALSALIGGVSFRVAERITGDVGAFGRDRQRASAIERTRTQAILDESRAETIERIASASDGELDFDDPTRTLPDWATWRTPRQLAWHIADTESRYYLTALGVESPPRSLDLVDELRRSAAHVRNIVATLPSDLVVEKRAEVWTTTKVLRRLGWHERGELAVLREVLARAERRKN